MKSDNSYQYSKEINFGRSLNWLVMLAGQSPSKQGVLQALENSDKVLAIDGGASILLEMGITPDLAIGDFDSILEKDLQLLTEMGVPLVTFKSNKDFTDLELGLDFLISIEAAIVRILGASDQDPDHHLANYMAISSDSYKMLRTEILNPPFRSFIAWEGVPSLIKGNPGDTISIIPISDEVEIQLFKGVKWPISNLKVTRGEGRTLRNQLDATSATLLTTKGKSIVVHKYA